MKRRKTAAASGPARPGARPVRRRSVAAKGRRAPAAAISARTVRKDALPGGPVPPARPDPMRDRSDAVPDNLPLPLPAEGLPDDRGQYAAERSKYDMRGDVPAPEPQSLPWGYGDNRICGLARDPYYLYVYWEVLDEAIAEARRRLGPTGGDAWFVLRIYETTGIAFDGTNARSYWDVGVDRVWNNYFLKVDRPRATFHVDIGLKSREGYFQVIARTGAIEMPADSVAPDGPVEWMTVQPDADLLRKPAYRHRWTPRPWSPGPKGADSGGIGRDGRADGAPVPVDERMAGILSALLGLEGIRGEWFEERFGGRIVRWVRWEGPRKRTEWRAGPFTIPLTFAGPIEIWIEGEKHVFTTQTPVPGRVYGPWRIVIVGIGAKGERRILDAWRVQYTWTTGGGQERTETPVIYRYIFGAYRKRYVLGMGSEHVILEESGASERVVGGASERAWIGGSETLLQGASETLFLGASQLQLGGASQFLFGGASELISGGASELRYLGASDVAFGGASDRLGGSETVAAGTPPGAIREDGGYRGAGQPVAVPAPAEVRSAKDEVRNKPGPRKRTRVRG